MPGPGEGPMEFVKTVGRWYARLLRAMLWLAAIYIGLMMVGIIYFTSMRSLGIPYSDYTFTFIEFGFIYALMLGAPQLVRDRGHVYIELVSAAVPDRVRVVMSRTVALLCFAICALLAWYTGVQTHAEMVGGVFDELRADQGIPRWIVIVAMPIGFGLMAIEFLRYVFAREPFHTGQAGVHE